jgi:short-subunit dehydrogenase
LYASFREQHASLGVTVLCPGLVNTRIYESERNRPQHLMPASGVAAETPELQAIATGLYAHGLAPEDVAEQTFEAIRDNRLYQITTSTFDAAVRERMTAILERRNPEFPSVLELSRADSRAR